MLESLDYEAREEPTSEETSAFASDVSSALSRFDPLNNHSGSRGRITYSVSATLSVQQPDASKPQLVLEEREADLLNRVRECFVLRGDKMELPAQLERYMGAWLPLAFDCFTLGELVRTADEASETMADLAVIFCNMTLIDIVIQDN